MVTSWDKIEIRKVQPLISFVGVYASVSAIRYLVEPTSARVAAAMPGSF
jgi:hypothetical protein